MDQNLLLDRYVLQETLGAGSGGVVNLAWDTRIQRNVAIKRIPLPQHSATSKIPGLDEARTGAQLSDSRIVNMIDFEVTDDEALLIMEYVDGISLGTLMDRIPRMLSASEIASVVQNVGKALQHAHQQHVLHLDVKPDNILIDATGMSKVTDFGIGQLARSAGYAGFGHAVGGTIGYMPPEQLTAGVVSEKTDQWAFAVLVYELIVGENPFIAPTFDESLELIEKAEITLPSSLDEGIDEELDDVLFRAMNPDPEKRYPSVAKFVTALLPHLGTPKTGRARLAKLIELFGDDVALGSPEERMRAMREQQMDQRTLPNPISDDDNTFYDTLDGGMAPEGDGWWDEDESQGMADAQDVDDYPEPDPYDQRMMVRRRSIKDAVGPRIAGVACHVVGGVCCGVLAYVGAIAMPLPASWWLWAIVCAVAAVGTVWPRVGSLVALASVCTGLAFAGWIPQTAILGILTVVWWAFVGRTGHAHSNCALLAPVAGMVGMALVQPLITGYFCAPRKALLTSVLGVTLMMVLFPLTGGELYACSLRIMPFTELNQAVVAGIYTNAGLWVWVAGWIIASLAMSLLANRGRKALSLAGAVLAMAIIIVSRVMQGVVMQSMFGLFNTNVIVACIVALAVTCLLIWVYTPRAEDRQ